MPTPEKPIQAAFRKAAADSAGLTEHQRLTRNEEMQGLVDELQAQGREATFNGVRLKDHILASGPAPGSTLGD